MQKGRKRNNQFLLFLDSKELKKLNSDCKRANISKAEYIRRLIMNKEIKEQPNEEFFYLLSKLVEIENEMRTLFHKADTLNMIDKDFYKEEADKWNYLITQIKMKYL